MPTLTTLTHWITKKPYKFLVFDTPDFTVSGRRYRIIATQLKNGETWHTIKNIDTRETREIEQAAMHKWKFE